MKTDLKPKDVFVTREGGEYRAWRVSDDGSGYTGIGRKLVPGDVVYLAVWKRERLYSRKSYTLKSGDVQWVSSGFLTEKYRTPDNRQTLDDMKKFIANIGDVFSGKTNTLNFPQTPTDFPVDEEHFIFVNRFTDKCPVWLRNAR